MVSEVYNMDRLEFMKQFPDGFFDLVIDDPPYGSDDAIGIKNSKAHKGKRKEYHLFDNVAPDEEYFQEMKRVSKFHIVWGGISLA